MPPAAADLDRRLTADVRPLLENLPHLVSWRLVPDGEAGFTAFDTTAKVVAAFDVWERLHGRIDRREMPPRGMPQPTDAERRMIGEWFSAVQEREAERHAGDPASCSARRLNNADNNYTIHDLTGVDIAPTRTFPVDPANEAGFDNSGETLAISLALLTDTSTPLATSPITSSFSRAASCSRHTRW